VTLRVVQWATGTVGRLALAAVHDHPDLDLVGVRVYGSDKVGADAGQLAGIGSIGVRATSDVEAIVALDADAVLYMPRGGIDPAVALDDVTALLRSGKNVVSTAVTAWIHPRSAGDGVADQLDAACRAGGVSFHGTGIEPGWASEVLPLTMSCLFRSIRSIRVQELLDYSTYPSRDMLVGIMGFGQPPDAEVPGADLERKGRAFRAPLSLVAEGLGAPIEDLRVTREVAVADEAFDVAAGRIDAGTVAAQRFSVSAVFDGREAITVEHITRLGEGQAPDWPTGRGWRVEIEGAPSMVLESRIAVHGEDENEQACLGTAMHAVHAIAPVCEAEAGIRTFLDLPMITGRGALRRG
jgi:hypothetical protein